MRLSYGVSWGDYQIMGTGGPVAAVRCAVHEDLAVFERTRDPAVVGHREVHDELAARIGPDRPEERAGATQ